jgi:hypothetical protein
LLWVGVDRFVCFDCLRYYIFWLIGERGVVGCGCGCGIVSLGGLVLLNGWMVVTGADFRWIFLDSGRERRSFELLTARQKKNYNNYIKKKITGFGRFFPNRPEFHLATLYPRRF